MIQRSYKLRSSHESAGPPLPFSAVSCSLRLNALSRSCASGVKGGILPSGGSIINDVRPSEYPRSHQNRLYASSTSLSGVAPRRSVPISVCLSCSALSSGVRNSLPAYLAGRWRGVVLAFVHEPCRSGSPHGVRHLVPAVFTAAVVFAAGGGVWPATGPATSDTITMTAASPPIEAGNRSCMVKPPLMFSLARLLTIGPFLLRRALDDASDFHFTLPSSQ